MLPAREHGVVQHLPGHHVFDMQEANQQRLRRVHLRMVPSGVQQGCSAFNESPNLNTAQPSLQPRAQLPPLQSPAQTIQTGDNPARYNSSPPFSISQSRQAKRLFSFSFHFPRLLQAPSG